MCKKNIHAHADKMPIAREIHCIKMRVVTHCTASDKLVSLSGMVETPRL